MSVLAWKGYRARVTFDAEAGLLVGRIAGINDVVGFHGHSVAGLRAAFERAVDTYVDVCRMYGKVPEKRYSGRVMFRVPPELHAEAALAAQLRGISLNRWVEEALRETVMVERRMRRPADHP